MCLIASTHFVALYKFLHNMCESKQYLWLLSTEILQYNHYFLKRKQLLSSSYIAAPGLNQIAYILSSHGVIWLAILFETLHCNFLA